MTSHCIFSRFLLFVFVLGSGSAHTYAQSPTPRKKAKSPAPPTAQPLTEAAFNKRLTRAKTLYREGRVFFQNKEFRKAIPKFITSYKTLQNLLKSGQLTEVQKAKVQKYQRAFLATLAVAYHWDKRYLQARIFYDRCQKQAKREKTKKMCKKYLPEVQKQLTFLQITTKPKQAKLSWTTQGKKSSKQTPYGKWMNPGKIELLVSHPGYQELRRALNLRPGVRASFYYELQKPSCPPGGIAAPKAPTEQLSLAPSFTTGALAAPAALPQPFSGGGMPGWQIALITGGVIVGATALTFGGIQIYRSTQGSTGVIE